MEILKLSEGGVTKICNIIIYTSGYLLFRYCDTGEILLCDLFGKFSRFDYWLPSCDKYLVLNDNKRDKLYTWNITRDEFNKKFDIPNGFDLFQVYGEFLISMEGSIRRGATYRFFDTKNNKGYRIKTKGVLVHFNGNHVVFFSSRTCELSCQKIDGTEVWNTKDTNFSRLFYMGKINDSMFAYYGESTSGNCELIVVNLDNGEKIFSRRFAGNKIQLKLDESFIYFYTRGDIVVVSIYDLTILFSAKVDGIDDVCTANNILFVISNSAEIVGFRKSDWLRLRPIKLGAFRYSGRGFQSAGDMHHISLSRSDVSEKRCTGWIGIFRDEDFLKGYLSETIEQPCFLVHERLNFDSANFFEIIFDKSTSFEVLVRQAQSAIHSTAFENGYYVHLPEKWFNKEFSGVIKLNLDGYEINEKEKRTIDIVCSEAQKLFDVMDLFAGDGKTKCSVVSIVNINQG